jgi:hypothetical protein
MWKYILLLITFSLPLKAQDNIQNSFVGKTYLKTTENGVVKTKVLRQPQVNTGYAVQDVYVPFQHHFNFSINTDVRWVFQDPAAIGSLCAVSGAGNRCATGWDLNFERISYYDSNSANALWEFNTGDAFLNHVALSNDGNKIASGSLRNIYVFDGGSSTPTFNFDLTTLPDTGIAGPVDITSSGTFIVACASRSDSSTIFGFNTSSTTPVWRFKVIPTVAVGGAGIYGIKMSGNDSLVIVNTYSELYVLRTYTGQLLFTTRINPTSNNGTQSPCAISGDGSVIANGNYNGYIRVHRWNGSTYAFQWQYQEPPGQFFNWMNAVDISYDGQFVAAGTLNFLTSSTYDGRVRVFRSTSSTPIWSFTGAGDEITSLSFSRSGNILSASSWGEFNHTTPDLYIFKTFMGNTPIYTLNTTGSFYWCSTSNDGKTVVTSGKAIHARAFGNGGLMYNIRVDTNDAPTGIVPGTTTASGYTLGQNYPNPFNPSTNLEFRVADFRFVSLKVYDVRGQEVQTLVNGSLQPGTYNVTFDGSKLSSGIYYYTLKAGDFTETRKMILVK